MNKGEVSISPTASPNAWDSTSEKDGRPGVFNSLRDLEKSSGKFRKLIHIIADVDILKYPSELIKSKKGNLTPSADKETLDGIKSEWFTETSRALLTGEYIFKTRLQGGCSYRISTTNKANPPPLCREYHLASPPPFSRGGGGGVDTEER